MESSNDLIYNTLPSQLELLNTVLISSEKFDDDLNGDEDAQDDIYDFSDDDDEEMRRPANLTASSSSSVIRNVGSMRSLSGADNMAYLEMSTSSGGFVANASRRTTTSGMNRRSAHNQRRR